MIFYLAIFAVVVIVILFLRRKKEAAGKRCWQCGAALEGDPYLCPECGETIQEDDDDDDPDPDEDDDDPK